MHPAIRPARHLVGATMRFTVKLMTRRYPLEARNTFELCTSAVELEAPERIFEDTPHDVRC